MSIGSPSLQQTSQSGRVASSGRAILVFTNHDRHVVAEALQNSGHLGSMEFREIPKKLNPEMFARMMELRVIRWRRKIVIDASIGGMDVASFSERIPEDLRGNIIALSQRVVENLPVTTVHVPEPIPIWSRSGVAI